MTKLLEHMMTQPPSSDPMYVTEERYILQGQQRLMPPPQALPRLQPQQKPVIVLNSSPTSSGAFDRPTLTRQNSLTKRKFDSPTIDPNKRLRNELSLPIPVNQHASPYSPMSPNVERAALNMIVNSVQSGALSPNSIFANVQNQLQLQLRIEDTFYTNVPETIEIADSPVQVQQQTYPQAHQPTPPKPIQVQKTPRKNVQTASPPVTSEDGKEFKYLVNMGRRPRKNKKVEPEDMYCTKFSLRS
jgi:hypothetical protein